MTPIDTAELAPDTSPDSLAEAVLFRQFFDISPDGLVLLDHNDRILKANQAWLDLFGYRLDEVQNQLINDLIVDDAFKDEASEISRRALSQKAVHQESLRCRKNDDLIHVDIMGTPINLGGDQIGIYAMYRDITDKRQTQDLLAQSEAKHRSIVETMEDGFYEVDLAGNLLFCNQAFCRLLQSEPEELRGLNNRDYLSADMAQTVYQAFNEVFVSGQPNPGFAWQMQWPDGSLRFMETSVTLMRNADGQPAGFRGLLRDVTDRIRTHKALFHEKELAQITLNAIADGVIRIDTKGYIEYLNPSALRLIGAAEKAVAGLAVSQIIGLADEETSASIHDSIARCLHGHPVDHRDGQAYLRRPDGGHCSIEFSAVPIHDAERAIVGAVIVFNDISEELRIRSQLAYQAEHDALTGLGNRFRFETEAEKLIQSAKSNGGIHTLLYMDLDQFKIVNDTCGHHAGDQLLRQLAVVIVNQVRHDDLVARLGGDEFGLLLADCPPERGALIAASIIQAINEFQFHWETRTFSVGISVGLVILDGKADSATLLKAADQACYAAKDQGRNRFQIYSSDNDALMQRSVELRAAADVDAAIRENRFELYYQRIVNLRTDNDPGHAEVLLRMRSRDGQLLSPGAFLPGAERYGKMAAIDRWVVRRVFDKMTELKTRGHLVPEQRFSINLSGSTINDPGFHDYVDTLLKSSGINAANVCFEITESSAVTNFAGANRFLQDMRNLGCRIMLDDFGSGLSSFTYLKMLPIDYLKIDGALIRDIAANPFDLAILRAIQDVARAIHVPVIAEHVQCQSVLDKLRSIGVEYAQGYFLHEPEPWVGAELQ